MTTFVWSANKDICLAIKRKRKWSQFASMSKEEIVGVEIKEAA